ncbi:MAG: hypothetical protein ACLT16_19860 [[Clostridium] innocuum]
MKKGRFFITQAIGTLKKEYYRRLGYAPQQQGLYDEFSGERFLTYMALLKDIGRGYHRRWSGWLLW